MATGIVLNVQKFSIHDGPGIRTLVFMKGCPLRCEWCANPESQQRQPRFGFIEARCTGCSKCAAVCPNHAISVAPGEVASTNRDLCTGCGTCIETCLYGAREIAGRRVTIDELLIKVEQDRSFYRHSGGGVTVGGGEPTQQHEFVREFLRECQERWLHTALETCGDARWDRLQGILQYVDTLYYDIKHMDRKAHRRLTGASNQLILDNFGKIARQKLCPEIVVRIPVVPGLTDSEENIAATAEYVAQFGDAVEGVELLSYHRLGMSKYQQFGMEYKLRDVVAPGVEEMERLEAILRSHGVSLRQKNDAAERSFSESAV